MQKQQGSSMSETRSSQRFHSLNSEQVKVLDQVLSEVVPIHGRGNFPTLELRPRDIVIAVRARLLKQGISVRDVRLNGSTASHVLVRDNGASYKDLDIIFGVELPRQEDFQVIKESVLGCLLDCLPAGVNRERISIATMKEAYVQKMVKVFTEQDRWSLISLSNNSGKNLELKFVSVLRRQFEFSVDSFQIILDPLLESYQKQEALQVASCLENKDQSSKNRNKDCLPLPAPESAPKTERFESTAKYMASSERAHINQAENKDETEDLHEKQPQYEFSQQSGPSNQVEHSNQTKHTKQNKLSKQKELTELNQLSDQAECSDQTEHSEQTEQLEQKESSEQREQSEDKEVSEHEKCTEREELSEQTDLSEQNELSQQAQYSDETEPPDKTKVLDHKELSDQTECSKQIEHSKQTEHSDAIDQPNQTEHSNHKRLSNEMELSVQKELSQHTESLVERTELSEQMSQTEPMNLAEHSHNRECSHETEDLNSSNEDQSHKEEDKTHSVYVSDTDTHTHAEVDKTTHSAMEKTTKTDTEQETQTETENDPETTAEQISITEATDVEQTLNIDKSPSGTSVSGAFPTHSTQPTGTQHTQETHTTLHIENPENKPDTLDTVETPTSQDKLLTQPSLATDEKTPSPPPGKAPSRLSQMVVLKHSSPKPPRKMCRKVTPNPNPNPVPEPEPVIVPSLDPDPSPSPEPETTSNPDPSPMSNLVSSPMSNPMLAPSTDSTPSTTIIIPTKTDPSPSPDSSLASKLDLTSTPNPAPDLNPNSTLEPTPVLPQEPPAPQLTTEPLPEIIIPILTETLPTQVAYDTESHLESSSTPEETASPFKQSQSPDSPDTLVSHTDTHHTQICSSTHTSETELSDEDENREPQVKMMELDPPPSSLMPAIQQATLSSPAPFPSDAPAIPCHTPPILSLSLHPTCFPPSSPSLSPPPSLTPPSHCLTPPMLSVSPPPSYCSPPLSFSPTSSCLSSPPYLTPMLNLSPPPLCLSPPSPCLSPPLLCLTPPVESEELVPQISSDPEPLIQNTQSEGQMIQSSPQPAVPLPHSQDKEDRDRISSLPQVPEPVSFPASIQSPNSDVLPHSQPEEKHSSAPPKAPEVPSSVPANTDAPKVSTDMAEQYKAPQASSAVPAVEVLAESMYGDFEAAMDHLRYRLIATRNPEEIRGGGLLKYSNLLVRDYRPASETQIKTLERYMCSRFFIDFPDVQEQQRKILSYLKNHFIGEERSKYQYLMTLRRVVDDSTVCLMGHERRQTLNMITVLALKVLGEQNIIPNTDHVTCFYQPAPYLAEHSAPYLAEPSYCSYYIPQGGSTLLYQPYPLHLHTQTGLV